MTYVVSRVAQDGARIFGVEGESLGRGLEADNAAEGGGDAH